MTKEFNEATPEAPSRIENSFPTQEKPMVIERVRSNKEGGVDMVLSLTKEQTYVLVNFAIMMLTSQGLAVFADEAQQQAEERQQPEPEIQAGDEVTIGKRIH